MDDDQQYERLDVDKDYEGGQWIGGEFYHQGKRQKRGQTKEDQLYGVFKDTDSDDDYRGRKGGQGGGKKDYTVPVGFVSSGLANKQPGADEGASFDVQGPPGMDPQGGGLGSSGRAGLGAPQPAVASEEEDEEDDHGVLSTALGSRWARDRTHAVHGAHGVHTGCA